MNNENDIVFSFIIPTFNEEEHIDAVINSIKQCVQNNYTYEIIVVDNGSSDKTPDIVKGQKVILLTNKSRTIAESRNLGARFAKGEIYIFLDGDVIITRKWVENIPSIINTLEKNPYIVTGSRCGISKSGSWIENNWFKPLLSEKANYINSGHLITTKLLFNKLSGFNSYLKTGEDYDFSMRAKKIGSTIINNPLLEVIHEGYPKTLINFVKREFWHGKGSYHDFATFLRSKTAIISIGVLILNFLLLSSLLLAQYWLTTICALSILFICLISSFIKYKQPLKIVLINSYIYYFYFCARGFSFISKLIK